MDPFTIASLTLGIVAATPRVVELIGNIQHAITSMEDIRQLGGHLKRLNNLVDETKGLTRRLGQLVPDQLLDIVTALGDYCRRLGEEIYDFYRGLQRNRARRILNWFATSAGSNRIEKYRLRLEDCDNWYNITLKTLLLAVSHEVRANGPDPLPRQLTEEDELRESEEQRCRSDLQGYLGRVRRASSRRYSNMRRARIDLRTLEALARDVLYDPFEALHGSMESFPKPRSQHRTSRQRGHRHPEPARPVYTTVPMVRSNTAPRYHDPSHNHQQEPSHLPYEAPNVYSYTEDGYAQCYSQSARSAPPEFTPREAYSTYEDQSEHYMSTQQPGSVQNHGQLPIPSRGSRNGREHRHDSTRSRSRQTARDPGVTQVRSQHHRSSESDPIRHRQVNNNSSRYELRHGRASSRHSSSRDIPRLREPDVESSIHGHGSSATRQSHRSRGSGVDSTSQHLQQDEPRQHHGSTHRLSSSNRDVDYPPSSQTQGSRSRSRVSSISRQYVPESAGNYMAGVRTSTDSNDSGFVPQQPRVNITQSRSSSSSRNSTAVPPSSRGCRPPPDHVSRPPLAFPNLYENSTERSRQPVRSSSRSGRTQSSRESSRDSRDSGYHSRRTSSESNSSRPSSRRPGSSNQLPSAHERRSTERTERHSSRRSYRR